MMVVWYDGPPEISIFKLQKVLFKVMIAKKSPHWRWWPSGNICFNKLKRLQRAQKLLQRSHLIGDLVDRDVNCASSAVDHHVASAYLMNIHHGKRQRKGVKSCKSRRQWSCCIPWHQTQQTNKMYSTVNIRDRGKKNLVLVCFRNNTTSVFKICFEFWIGSVRIWVNLESGLALSRGCAWRRG